MRQGTEVELICHTSFRHSVPEQRRCSSLVQALVASREQAHAAGPCANSRLRLGSAANNSRFCARSKHQRTRYEGHSTKIKVWPHRCSSMRMRCTPLQTCPCRAVELVNGSNRLPARQILAGSVQYDHAGASQANVAVKQVCAWRAVSWVVSCQLRDKHMCGYRSGDMHRRALCSYKSLRVHSTGLS